MNRWVANPRTGENDGGTEGGPGGHCQQKGKQLDRSFSFIAPCLGGQENPVSKEPAPHERIGCVVYSPGQRGPLGPCVQ